MEMRNAERLADRVRSAGDCVWEMPPDAKPGMRVPARIYASRALLEQMDEGVFEQVSNVACLPGIVRAALCMPDGHWGYGFPIGGVAAFRADGGVISPGGIGFDINCGMRLIRTELTEDEVRPRLAELVGALFEAVPSGVGAKGFVLISRSRTSRASWSTAHGAGRTMSRAEAKRRVGGETLIKQMEERGIILRAASRSGVAEEAGFAYKDLAAVVDVLDRLDVSRKVVSLTPIGNIKG
jgi:tRNA-splicing ligase RtcB (3'-phosphate/5'-hydroxy nucleic acid ligase)